eukprot:TRINITY_DN17778_c0_g2_i2.p1 TRINITY_DN17778_c0_g2~~TRINITY_DN17778_c0_g2_i2.p1  ORF type:complete len:261 (+),score=19.39 TRINITY_DN17778_c0_g2_i2:147-929(+)
MRTMGRSLFTEVEEQPSPLREIEVRPRKMARSDKILVYPAYNLPENFSYLLYGESKNQESSVSRSKEHEDPYAKGHDVLGDLIAKGDNKFSPRPGFFKDTVSPRLHQLKRKDVRSVIKRIFDRKFSQKEPEPNPSAKRKLHILLDGRVLRGDQQELKKSPKRDNASLRGRDFGVFGKDNPKRESSTPIGIKLSPGRFDLRPGNRSGTGTLGPVLDDLPASQYPSARVTLGLRGSPRAIFRIRPSKPVSYTHLTLPTIYSV